MSILIYYGISECYDQKDKFDWDLFRSQIAYVQKRVHHELCGIHERWSKMAVREQRH